MRALLVVGFTWFGSAALNAAAMPTPNVSEQRVYTAADYESATPTGEIHLFKPKLAKWSLLYPSDLGPADIDVSRYSKEDQHTYKYIIPERCLRCHTAARIWNSPIVEMEGSALAQAKKAQPWLYKTGNLVKAEPQYWRRYIKRMRQMPACCGGCSDLSLPEMKAITGFLDRDSIKRKTGKAGVAWATHRQKLIKEFVKRKPESRASYAADLKFQVAGQ